VTSFGFDPPPVVSFPGILHISKIVRIDSDRRRHLPERLVKGSGVPSHDFRSRGAVSFVKNFVKVCLLLESVDVVWGLWRYQQVVLAYQAIVRGLWQLVMLD
jgi:hypothetical protein